MKSMKHRTFYIQIKDKILWDCQEIWNHWKGMTYSLKYYKPWSSEKNVKVQRVSIKVSLHAPNVGHMAGYDVRGSSTGERQRCWNIRMCGLLVNVSSCETGLAHDTLCSLGTPAIKRAMNLWRVCEPAQPVSSLCYSEPYRPTTTAIRGAKYEK